MERTSGNAPSYENETPPISFSSDVTLLASEDGEKPQRHLVIHLPSCSSPFTEIEEIIEDTSSEIEEVTQETQGKFSGWDSFEGEIEEEINRLTEKEGSLDSSSEWPRLTSEGSEPLWAQPSPEPGSPPSFLGIAIGGKRVPVMGEAQRCCAIAAAAAKDAADEAERTLDGLDGWLRYADHLTRCGGLPNGSHAARNHKAGHFDTRFNTSKFERSAILLPSKTILEYEFGHFDAKHDAKQKTKQAKTVVKEIKAPKGLVLTAKQTKMLAEVNSKAKPLMKAKQRLIDEEKRAHKKSEERKAKTSMQVLPRFSQSVSVLAHPTVTGSFSIPVMDRASASASRKSGVYEGEKRATESRAPIGIESTSPPSHRWTSDRHTVRHPSKREAKRAAPQTTPIYGALHSTQHSAARSTQHAARSPAYDAQRTKRDTIYSTALPRVGNVHKPVPRRGHWQKPAL
jgi:hypothetical protein